MMTISVIYSRFLIEWSCTTPHALIQPIEHEITYIHTLKSKHLRYVCENWRTKVSWRQTCLRFSGFTSNRLHKANKVSNNVIIKLELTSLMHFWYSLTSQMAHKAPVIYKKLSFCNSFIRFSDFTSKKP